MERLLIITKKAKAELHHLVLDTKYLEVLNVK